MARVDMRGIYVAKAERTPSGITYSGGRHLADATSANVELDIVEGKFPAEGRMKRTLRKISGAKITLGTDTLDYAAEEMLLGHKFVEADGQISKLDDRPGPVGLGFYVEDTGDSGTEFSELFYEARVYPHVTFAEGNDSAKTFGGSYEFGTNEMVGTIEAKADGEWRIRKQFDTAEAAVAWIKTKLSIAGGTEP